MRWTSEKTGLDYTVRDLAILIVHDLVQNETGDVEATHRVLRSVGLLDIRSDEVVNAIFNELELIADQIVELDDPQARRENAARRKND